MREEIKSRQETIAADVRAYLAQHKDEVYWGLGAGRTGILLYLFYAYKHELITGFEQFEEETLALSNVGLNEIGCSYGAGKAGLNWFYQVMFNQGLLDQEDVDLLCFDDEYLESFAYSALQGGNYDFLYGSTGAAAYLLFRYGQEKEAFFIKLMAAFNTLVMQYKGAVPAYNLSENRLVPEMVNLGLAHGLPAILKFCILCYNRSVCREESRALALQLIAYLRAQVNTDTRECYFPSVVEEGAVSDEKLSRLGWCYGDLGIAYVLYQAALTFADEELRTFALTVLEHSTQRRHNEQTLVHDAGFCHGSAGIAHFYNRLWLETEMPVFREATDYWMQQTLAYAKYEDGAGGYKKWDGASRSWERDYSLLEGAAGIGLVMISYLTGDCSWDYSLMLEQ